MKRTLKAAANGVAFLLVLPAYGCFQLARLAMGADRAFPGWSQAFSLLPGHIGVYLRRAFYSLVFPRCGTDVHIGFGSLFSHAAVQLGHRVYIGPFCSLGVVILEDDVLLASGVSIINGSRQHGTERLDIPIREQPGQWPQVTIGQDSWIGERAIVMTDVGQHCIVAAGSIVTKPLPDYAIAVGAPARIVRYRDGREGTDQHPPASA